MLEMEKIGFLYVLFKTVAYWVDLKKLNMVFWGLTLFKSMCIVCYTIIFNLWLIILWHLSWKLCNYSPLVGLGALSWSKSLWFGKLSWEHWVQEIHFIWESYRSVKIVANLEIMGSCDLHVFQYFSSLTERSVLIGEFRDQTDDDYCK